MYNVHALLKWPIESISMKFNATTEKTEYYKYLLQIIAK